MKKLLLALCLPLLLTGCSAEIGNSKNAGTETVAETTKKLELNETLQIYISEKLVANYHYTPFYEGSYEIDDVIVEEAIANYTYKTNYIKVDIDSHHYTYQGQNVSWALISK